MKKQRPIEGKLVAVYKTGRNCKSSFKGFRLLMVNENHEFNSTLFLGNTPLESFMTFLKFGYDNNINIEFDESINKFAIESKDNILQMILKQQGKNKK